MKKIILIAFSFIIVIFGVLMFLRLFANGGEDTWICNQGVWVKHGQPSRPAPSGSCNK